MRVTTALIKTALAFALGLCVTAAQGDTGPASTSTRDLIAFANQGTSTSLGGGVTRKQRTVFINGKEVTVAVDSLPGFGNGLVQYRRGENVYLYTVAGEPITNIRMPSGNYVGVLTLNYQVAKGKPVRVAVGDMGMTLDAKTGNVAIGGLAGNRHNNIEFFADAKARDGAFTATNSIVRLRDGNGNFIRDHKGTVKGTLATGKKGSAIFGTVSSRNEKTGWKLRGGYTAIRRAGTN